MSIAQLARVANVPRNSLSQNPESPAVQGHLEKVARVITMASEILGGDTTKAVLWFRYHPLSDFDGVTAEELMAGGHSDAVLAHLDTVRNGGFA
ncbi:hypothetical protein [Arenibaculum pallidiluteum]|uniref:hypothetical protein n=1 Tax=Arenibaculum pallidiluteum TaxID=2812559 RepID=UPI001A9775ED|nr:hypothetical protein [Arenibaculum pallidiluteum]